MSTRPNSFLMHVGTDVGTLPAKFELSIELSSFAEQFRTGFGMLLASVWSVTWVEVAPQKPLGSGTQNLGRQLEAFWSFEIILAGFCLLLVI